LLQDFVDVDGEGLDSSSSGFSFGSLDFRLSWFFSHFGCANIIYKLEKVFEYNIDLIKNSKY